MIVRDTSAAAEAARFSQMEAELEAEIAEIEEKKDRNEDLTPFEQEKLDRYYGN